jgi:hypothetical protein
LQRKSSSVGDIYQEQDEVMFLKQKSHCLNKKTRKQDLIEKISQMLGRHGLASNNRENHYHLELLKKCNELGIKANKQQVIQMSIKEC